MRTRLFGMLPLCLVLLTAGSAAQPPVPTTVIMADRLLDPRSRRVLAPAAVLIDGATIKLVGAPSEVVTKMPRETRRIDLGRATLLPGLIDSHTHLLLDLVVPPDAESSRHWNGIFAPGLLVAIAESPIKRAFLGAQNAREDLETASPPSATWAIPGSTATPNCATPSTQAASQAPGFSQPAESW